MDVDNSRLLTPKIRTCYAPSGPGCDETQAFVTTLSDGSALPSFLVQIGTVIEVDPQISTDIGTWTLKIASTPVYGAALEYNSMAFTISCTIVSIVDPAPPTTDLQYTLYDATHSVDLSANVYQQVPPCDFPLTMTYTWDLTATDLVFTQNVDNPAQVDTVTLDKSKLNADPAVGWGVSMTANMSHAPTGQSWQSLLTFAITIVDPCLGTVLNSFTPDVLTVINGESAFITFNDITDTVEELKQIDTLCGPRSYELFESDGTTPATTWVLLTGGPETLDVYSVTATPDLPPESPSGTFTY